MSSKDTTAISARIRCELIEYMRMKGINVNKAINNALLFFIVVYHKDEEFRRYYDKYEDITVLEKWDTNTDGIL